MNGSTLNYKNSAEVVVGVPGCFPWRQDAEDSQLNRYGECQANWESKLETERGLQGDQDKQQRKRPTGCG